MSQHNASEWSKLLIHENLTKRDRVVASRLRGGLLRRAVLELSPSLSQPQDAQPSLHEAVDASPVCRGQRFPDGL